MENETLFYNIKSNLNLYNSFASYAYTINFLQKLEIPFYKILCSHENINNISSFFESSKVSLVDLNSQLLSFKNEQISSPFYFFNLKKDKIAGNTALKFYDLFSINKNILEKAQNYKKPIGIHLRCKMRQLSEMISNDFLKKEAEKEEEKYINLFLEIYHPFKEYLIVSDSFLLTEKFQKYPNVTVFNRKYMASIPDNRFNFLEDTVLELASLSLCDVVYRTTGGFANLAASFNKKCVLKDLIFFI